MPVPKFRVVSLSPTFACRDLTFVKAVVAHLGTLHWKAPQPAQSYSLSSPSASVCISRILRADTFLSPRPQISLSIIVPSTTLTGRFGFIHCCVAQHHRNNFSGRNTPPTVSHEMSAPTSSGIFRGMGTVDRGRALVDENRLRFYSRPDFKILNVCKPKVGWCEPSLADSISGNQR